MEKKQVIERLCALVSEVRSKVYHDNIPADCFCGQKEEGLSGFQFNESVLEFIELSVRSEIQRDLDDQRWAASQERDPE